MYCGKCGASIPDGDIFCSKCGAPISVSSELSSEQLITQTVLTTPDIVMAQPTTKTNGVAITGFVFGIVAAVLCWVPFFGMMLGIVGFVLSLIGLKVKKDRGSGGGLAVSGLILSIIGALWLSLMLGIASYTKKAEAANKIPNKEQQIGNITYEVPESWAYEESGDHYYYDIKYYPEKNNTKMFLYVEYMEFSDPIEKDAFERVADGAADLLLYDEGMERTSIDKSVEEKDYYYIERASIYATSNGVKREVLVYAACDKRTGQYYCFRFLLPENESEEYRKAFNLIVDSIELR